MGSSGSKEAPLDSQSVQNVDARLTQEKDRLEKLASRLEGEELTEDLWFESIEQVVKYTQGADALASLQKPISDAVVTHKLWKKLMNSDALVDHTDRVKAVMDIHHTEWRLLRDTSQLLTQMSHKVHDVLEAIADYKKESMSEQSIKDCIETLEEWLSESHKIGDLAKEWNQLYERANAEQVEWKKIQGTAQRHKEEAAQYVRHYGVVTAVATGVLCFFAGALPGVMFTVVLGSEVFASASLVLAVLGLGAASAKLKEIKEINDQCSLITGFVGSISSRLGIIADNAKEVEHELNGLNDHLESQQKSVSRIHKASKKLKLEEWNLKKSADKIARSLEEINGSLVSFDKQCKQTLQIIHKAQNKIANY